MKEEEKIMEDAPCECCKAEEDIEEKMGYWIDPEAPIMYNEIHEMINHYPPGTLFIAFEMGSIRLDIQDPHNWLEVNRTYLKAYNHENGETAIMKIEKIMGFIYEPLPEPMSEDLEEELRKELGLDD